MITTCLIHCGAGGRGPDQVQAVSRFSTGEVVCLSHGGSSPLPIPDNWKVIRREELLSVPIARNLCIRECTNDYTLWLDDDIVPSQEYEAAFLRGFQSDDRAGIVGYEALIIQLDFENQWFVDPVLVPNFDYLDSPFAVSVDMVNELGGFDEQLGQIAGSNTDLCIRAISAGWKMVTIKNPGLKHYRSKRQEKYRGRFDLTEETKKSHDRLRAKHGSSWKNPQVFIIDPKLQYPDLRGRTGGPEDKRG